MGNRAHYREYKPGTSAPFDLVLTASAGTTPEIDYRDVQGGFLYVPDGSSVTTLTWHAAPALGKTYEPAYDESGALTTTVAANRAIRIPLALAHAGAIKAVSNAAGTIQISLKS